MNENRDRSMAERAPAQPGKMNPLDFVPGDLSGIMFPTTIEPLLNMGAGFLTRAFQSAGVLSQDNRVTAITSSSEFFGGGMGRKLRLTVDYEHSEAGLTSDLFVKFPRNFGDPLRDLFAPLMEPEVRFARLSRREDFPIVVPRCYFADYHADTRSGILITERIAYGHGAIEPCQEKCLDQRMTDAPGHYRALTRAMARLAGFHKSGRFGSATDLQFPFDPGRIDVGSRIPYSADQLRGKLRKLEQFASDYPQLMPGDAGSTSFLQRFCGEVPLILEHELAIRRYLNHNEDYIALCHWNMNVDNAWFWADADGSLQAGLLDWGSVGQMNVAQAYYGMTCAAETDFLESQHRGLMALFIDEYAHAGGPALQLEELAFQVRLAIAVLGVAWILDAPSIVEAQLPNLRNLTGRDDSRLRSDFLARCQLQLLNVLLNEWLTQDIGASLRQFSRLP